MTKLQTLASAYRRMPNRGALLTVSDNGTIGNGMVIVDRQESRRTAEKALRTAGFIHSGAYWKLAVEAS